MITTVALVSISITSSNYYIFFCVEDNLDLVSSILKIEFPLLGVGIKSDMNTKIVKMFLDYSFSLETLDKRSIVLS